MIIKCDMSFLAIFGKPFLNLKSIPGFCELQTQHIHVGHSEIQFFTSGPKFKCDMSFVTKLMGSESLYGINNPILGISDLTSNSMNFKHHMTKMTTSYHKENKIVCANYFLSMCET